MNDSMPYDVYAKCNGCGGGNGHGIGFGYASGNNSVCGIGNTVIAHHRYDYNNLINVSGGGMINVVDMENVKAGVGAGCGVWSPYFLNDSDILQIGCMAKVILPMEVVIQSTHK